MLEIEANLDTKLKKKKKKRSVQQKHNSKIARYTFKTTIIQNINSLKGLKQENTEHHKRITTFSLEIGVCSTLKTTTKIPHR